MKKFLYLGALTAFLLTGCSSHDEAPASEQAEAKEKTVFAETKGNFEKSYLYEAEDPFTK
ncbi:hypothetical protein ABE61_03865 [Lysinibacillus sphaericus]|uniref:hypothetical protein n=1 Tax=Lysinibacillus sphaericus TaxID=1421 RepID=UPI0018CDA86B|nr:hypothetical protein [Lysinibacillus sphaericus]MBG9453232.1 hypothetical protein [Lysinibacillus sphaericus]MBG9476086.1 hypothetical protein [Lysinibacillus sphaericus]MBG9591935.1 hypothetical protein [Lysinibacillus sphaericus]